MCIFFVCVCVVCVCVGVDLEEIPNREFTVNFPSRCAIEWNWIVPRIGQAIAPSTTNSHARAPLETRIAVKKQQGGQAGRNVNPLSPSPCRYTSWKLPYQTATCELGCSNVRCIAMHALVQHFCSLSVFAFLLAAGMNVMFGKPVVRWQ